MDVNLLVSLSVLLALVTGKPAHTQHKNAREEFISKDIELPDEKSVILNALGKQKTPTEVEGTRISAAVLPDSIVGRQRRNIERHRRQATSDRDQEPRTEIDKTAEMCREICRYGLCGNYFVSLLPPLLN